MTSIYDIPYEDIKIFLLGNNKNFSDIDEAYAITQNLLKDKKAKGHTTSIIEWMIAHNLLTKKVNIPYYTVDQIDSMPQVEINQLSKLLKMKSNNRNNIKNILRYLNKLDDKELLLSDINKVILDTLTQLEIQDIDIYEMSLAEIILLLKTHRNKKEIRKFISDNLEKIVGYHSISIRLNDPDYADYVIEDIFQNANIYNKNTMIEIIKDLKTTFLKYNTNEEINNYIKEIERIDENNEIYEAYPVMNDLVIFTLDLIAIDEIGLAKQTFDIINKFKLSTRSHSYNYELVKRMILSEYTDVLKNIINFMGEKEFVKMFDEFLRNETTDSQYIKSLSYNLIRLGEYNALIDILKTLIDYLRYNYRGGEAIVIENILKKIKKAIKSKNNNLIIGYIKSIQTVLDSDDSD